MIEATITKPRWIGGDWHERRVTAELLLHGTNCTLQGEAERLGKGGEVVELKRAHDLAEAALVRTDPCASSAAGWRGTAFNAASTSETELAATFGAEERPLDAAGAATLWGEER
jgi:hypothetical protein